MSCFDNSTAEDISSIDDSTEDEDPLFGNFEGDSNLKKLLSPKKRKRNDDENGNIIDPKQMKPMKKSPIGSTGDILQQLKNRMGDNLEKELGFSLNDSKLNSTLIKSYGFKKLLDEVKKEKEIDDIIKEESLEEMKKTSAEAQITKWIESHVDHKFLYAEVSGLKINQKWISALRKILRKVVMEDNMIFDETKVRSSLSKFPQYYNFRCFTDIGHMETSSVGFLEHLLEKNKLNTLIYSNNVKYVESFQIYSLDEEIPDKKQILQALGCDVDLLLNMNQVACRTFDSKNLLPSLGCGFEILKFVQLLNTTEYKIFDKREAIRILMLLSSDYNSRLDNTHYIYKGGYFTGKEIGLKKLWEFRGDPDLLTQLHNTFKEEPELWFDIIRSFCCTSFTEDLTFKGKLTLHFLFKNDPHRTTYELKNTTATLEDLFIKFDEYLSEWGRYKLKQEDESLLDVIKWKVELMKDWLLVTNVILKKWEADDFKRDLIKNIAKSINHLKTDYFADFDKSLNAIVPQCKKILDFLYYEITVAEVEDVFAE